MVKVVVPFLFVALFVVVVVVAGVASEGDKGDFVVVVAEGTFLVNREG